MISLTKRGLYIVCISIIIALGLGALDLYAQKKATATSAKTTQKTNGEISNLKKDQKKIENQVRKLGQGLEETRLSTRQAIQEVGRLQMAVDERTRMIEEQSREIDSLGNRASNLEKEILLNELNYNHTKERYVDLIYRAYVKNSSYSKLMFVLSAETFYETYRRFRYIQNFADLRKKQAIQLEEERKALVERRHRLDSIRNASQELLALREKDRAQLVNEKTKQDNLVSSLKSKEKEIQRELDKQSKEAQHIADKIQRLIEEQAQAAAKKQVQKQQQKSTSSTSKTTNTSASTNSAFAKTKGKLQMPVPGGKITGRFGVQPHPVLRHVTINNKGIYVTGAKGENARAVYAGEVTQRFSIPGSNNAVIIRHDNYLTVYSNLTTIFVKNGDKVTAGQKIGKIYEDPDDDGRVTLFFQIWREKELLNPEEWIVKTKK